MTIPNYVIAKDFTAGDYKALLLDEFPNDDWQKAVDAFSTRFNSRFFTPLLPLKGPTTDKDSLNGFIVLSCTFILVETLGGFLEGMGSHSRESMNLFVKGLDGLTIRNQTGENFPATTSQKRALYSTGRCAVLHTAGTENIKVKTTGPMFREVEGGGFEINRNAFLEWVEERFKEYATRLMHQDSDDLRRRFKTKMDFIAAR